jgi:transketolase
VRTAFIESLVEQARERPEIFLVVGDLGYSVVERFRDEFPDRFLNAGVAEQNMTGVAAGLASEGYHVFTYSIANFPTLRCLEQIRNDVCYHRLAVTVVSVGAGVAYGNLGYSHHAVQDIGILCSMPEMTVLSPADPGETRECVGWLAANPCPSYLRLGKAGESPLHTCSIEPGIPVRVCGEGRARTAIIATGSVLKVGMEAAAELAKEGIAVDVYSASWIQPMGAAVAEVFRNSERLLVLEEHLSACGFGALLRGHLRREVDVLGLSPGTLGIVGSQESLRRASGLDVGSVVNWVKCG